MRHARPAVIGVLCIAAGVLVGHAASSTSILAAAAFGALAGVPIAVAAFLPEYLRARRNERRATAAVEARIAEVRELRPTDDLESAADPTPGTIRRARQARGKRTPRARKRRTGRWG